MLSARRQLGPTSKSVDGPAASRSWNGNTAQPLAYSYDAAKRPVSASASVTAGTVSLTQSYDRGGNVAAEGRTMPAAVTGDAGSGTQSFSYDALSRLTGSSGLLAGSVAYTCGLDSGRASRTAGAHAYAAVYDRTGELASVSLDGGFPVSAAYDAYGGLTSDPQAGAAGSATAYGYDLAGRTVSVTPAGASATSIALDALGRPRTRTTGSSADAYSYLGDTGSVVRVANTGGSGLTTDSVLDPAGGRLGAKTGTAVAWLAPDLHGSVAAALAKDAASVTGALRYDGYGLTLASWPSGGTAATSTWKYQGRLDLSPSSAAPLYDFGARDYAPGLGAFTSMDTVTGSARDPGQLGRFLYAEGNPASLVDPTGHDACTGAECDNPTYDNGREGFDYCVADCGASKTKYGPGDTGYKPYKPPAKPPVKPPAKPAQGVPLTVTASMLDALTAGQLRAYVDARAAACAGAPANMPGCQDYGYAWCRQALDRQTCLQWVDLKDWGDLDGPLGTFVVAPASAILVSLGWAALVSVAGPAKDRVSSAAEQIPAAGWYGPMKPTPSDADLRGIVEQLYRSTATIGNGGTGDAIRDGAGHVIKGAERITNLQRWIDSHPFADPQDVHIAESMLQDLISAMSGQAYPGH